jgi:hypothetical protein
MKHSKLFIFLALCPFLFAHTCKKDPDCPADGHNGITITNHSNVRIRCNFYWNHPNTAIGEYNPSSDGTDGLSPNESLERGAGPQSCWESVFMGGRKEWIYIFDADTIETLSWEVVRQTNRGLLERREIDLPYLQQNGFEIIYQ